MPESVKPFDLNLYFKAVGVCLNEFFTKKLPDFFKKPDFNGIPQWWKSKSQDLQLAFSGLFIGFVLLIVGIVLLFM